MRVKELQKIVNIAWSPLPQYPIYLAAGTAAQQFDSSGNSCLEIYSTNLNDPSYDLELKTSLPSQYRYQKLIWSPTGYESSHPNGLLVGGCEGGHVMIYSVARMFAGEEGLIARQDKHTGPVSGLDFNPFQTNLLASVASESEIFIWDLNNTSTHMNPGSRTQPYEDVQNVAWNRQVQHILASVFSTRCVIWDLRKTEQIIKLSDTQSRVRWRAIQWHPDVATQLWLASEDDQAPVVQLWDLRYATSPAKSMLIHNRGVLSMSWCPKDSDLMVSCGKDNHIYCWNPNTDMVEGDILSEVATTTTWYSDVQWCPRNPALIASSSLDGNVSIYSLFGGRQQQVQTSKKIADSFPGMDSQTPFSGKSTCIQYQDLKRPPKWIKRQCGVSFGFGGKLIEFNSKSKYINMSQVISEPELVEQARALECSLSESKFEEHCRQRADQVTDKNKRCIWQFVKANFNTNPREEILNLLGYDKRTMENKFSKYGKVELSNINELTNQMENLNHQSVDKSDVSFREETEAHISESCTTKPILEFKIPSGQHPDSLISEALLTENIEAAVELCMEKNRTTEALIIASTQGIEFLTRTQLRCLEKESTDLSNVLTYLVTRDWMDFVSHCSIDSWKEALVFVLNHSDRKVENICEKLGDRLLAHSSYTIENIYNAILCFICAGSLNKIVTTWYKLKQIEHSDSNYKLNTFDLQELAEIVMIMSKSLEQQGIAKDFEDKLNDFILEYVCLLASQGALNIALAYITAVAPSDNLSLDELRQRIYNTLNYKDQKHQKMFSIQNHQQLKSQHNNGFSHESINKPITAVPNLMPTNQLPANPWNCSLDRTTDLIQPPVSVLNPIPASNISSLGSTTAKPPQIMDTFGQPSRNLSSTPQSAGLPSRSKYVVDPSVATSDSLSHMGGYGGIYTPGVDSMSTSAAPPMGNLINSSRTISTSQMQSFQNPSHSTPPLHSGPDTNYTSEMSAMDCIQSQKAQQIYHQNSPAGWNDPPALKFSRASKNTAAPPPTAAPITHPLFGVDANQNDSGRMDLNSPYQSILQPGLHTSQPSTIGGYKNPPPINNNAPQFQQQNRQSPNIPPNNQQPQQWTPPTQNMGPIEQQAPMQSQTEVAKEKPPMPEEYIYLQTVLEELKTLCLAKASDPRLKRKFVDVTKRLDNLYDCLRDNKLAPITVASLTQIVQYIQIGDYANAMQTHTSIAFGSDFSQCAGFMPGLKTLIQSANDLQVYLR